MKVQAVVCGELAKPERSQHRALMKPVFSSMARNTIPGTVPSCHCAHEAGEGASASLAGKGEEVKAFLT